MSSTKELFLTVLEAYKSEIRVPARSDSSEGPLADNCLLTVSSLGRESAQVSVPCLTMASVLLDQDSTLIISFKPNYRFNGPVSNKSRERLGLQLVKSGGHNSVHSIP